MIFSRALLKTFTMIWPAFWEPVATPRVVVMYRGSIEQDGPPDEVYDRPATPSVLQFLGDVDLSSAASATRRAATSTRPR